MISTLIIGTVIAVSLLLAAATVMLASAFTRVTMADLDVLAEYNPKAAQRWNSLIAKQDQVLSALSVAYLCFIVIAITCIARYGMVEMHVAGMALVMLGFVIIMVVATYYLPKMYMYRQESNVLLKTGLYIACVYRVFVLPAWLLVYTGNALTQAFKNQFYMTPHLVFTKGYFNLFARHRHLIGLQNPAIREKAEEQARMNKALDEYLDKTVADVMVPIKNIPMIDGLQPMEKLVELVLSSYAERMILFQEDMTQIIGILHSHLFTKAVALAEGDLNAVDMMSAISEPLYIADNMGIATQIRDFKQYKQSFALIHDRNHQLIGGVSLNNLLDHAASLAMRAD